MPSPTHSTRWFTLSKNPTHVSEPNDMHPVAVRDDDRVLVVNREEADKAHARIMAKHRVPSRVSRDLEA